MKSITKYVSEDGREFTDEKSCATYEALCNEVDAIMSRLIARPNLPSCSFENGAGYIQQDPSTAQQAKLGILSIANRIYPHAWFDQSISDKDVHPSWAGRLIGEFSQKCMYQAWSRFQCMDKQFREYGQPYYALHPEKADDVKLN